MLNSYRDASRGERNAGTRTHVKNTGYSKLNLSCILLVIVSNPVVALLLVANCVSVAVLSSAVSTVYAKVGGDAAYTSLSAPSSHVLRCHRDKRRLAWTGSSENTVMAFWCDHLR